MTDGPNHHAPGIDTEPSARAAPFARAAPSARAAWADDRFARGRLVLLLAIASWVTAAWGAVSVGRADVVMPPPTDCPRGAVGASVHGGPYCAPTSCVRAADCQRFRRVGITEVDSQDDRCLPAGLCLRQQTTHGGHGHSVELTIALGSCSVPEDCPQGSSCEVETRCVRADAPDDGEPTVVPPAYVPREIRSVAPGACGGAAASVLVLAALLAIVGVSIARRASVQASRAAAARSLLVEHGRLSHREALDVVRVEGEVSRALAPLASRVRVEVEAAGEVVYVLRDPSHGATNGRG